jgi:hypothetical protein
METKTEEDTFNKLKRLDFYVLLDLYNKTNFAGEFRSSFARLEFCKRHGWEWIEFLLHAKKEGVILTRSY